MSRPEVFISYSHADTDPAWVREFARALEAEKLSVWLDSEQLKPGDRWAEGLERALRESVAIIAIVGPSSAGSSALFWELGAALGMGKRVIPVVPTEFEASRLPYPLRARHALRQGSPEQTAKLVAATIAAADEVEQRK
jgi:TIR domain